MIQLPRVGWRLLACENGASTDCIIGVVVVVFVRTFTRDVYVDKSWALIVHGALDNEELFVIEGSKKWRGPTIANFFVDFRR